MITHPTTQLCFSPAIYPGYIAVTHEHTPNYTTLFLTRNLPRLHCSHTWSHTQQRIFVSHLKSTQVTLQSSVISYAVYVCCTLKIYPGYTATKRDLLPCLCLLHVWNLPRLHCNQTWSHALFMFAAHLKSTQVTLQSSLISYPVNCLLHTFNLPRLFCNQTRHHTPGRPIFVSHLKSTQGFTVIRHDRTPSFKS